MPLRSAPEFNVLVEKLSGADPLVSSYADVRRKLYEIGRTKGHADASVLDIPASSGHPAPLLAHLREHFVARQPKARVEATGALHGTVAVELPSTLESERELKLGVPPGGPTCDMTAGYLAGWSSRIAAQQLVATETACRATGAPCCRFVLEALPGALPPEIDQQLAPSAELSALRAELTHEREARADAETRLGRAHKLEALGHMSGAIAHDFNNLMTVVLARGALLESRLGEDQTARSHLREMMRATERAAGLTRQLLSFPRVRPTDSEPIDVGDALGRIGRMLESLVGDSIILEFGFPPDPLPAAIDRGELEQIVMNLVVNARDALGGAGQLWVSAAKRAVHSARTVTTGSLASGVYAVLAVRDDGAGMSDEVRSHIFDPFFTTKSEGHGTGLGLSTVYALVLKHGGVIDVTTALGRGSCFEVYLPLSAPEPLPPPLAAPLEATSGRGETVVVVDDRPEIRAIVCDLLSADGYHPISFERGDATLAWARTHEGPIELLLTDVKMPHMDGPILAEAFSAIRPETSILYMSGYSEYAVKPLLAKPFTAKELLGAVRAILDERPLDQQRPVVLP